MKKILGHQITRDGHQSAGNRYCRGGSTEDFSKNGLENAKNIKTSQKSKKKLKIMITSQNSNSVPARIRSEVSSSENQ